MTSTSSSSRTFLPEALTISVRRSSSSTPYEKAAARVPPPENASTTSASAELSRGGRVS